MLSINGVIRCVLVMATLGAVAGSASADGLKPLDGIEPLTPGVASTLPDKGVLPRREGMVVATVGAELFGGPSSFGANAVASLRLAEIIGFGIGLRGATDGGPFLRMEAIGLAVNHWAFIGFADYAFSDGWWVGGALIAPLRRDTYVRVAIGADEHGNGSMSLGVEYDLW